MKHVPKYGTGRPQKRNETVKFGGLHVPIFGTSLLTRHTGAFAHITETGQRIRGASDDTK